jgi:Predicted membrane protein
MFCGFGGPGIGAGTGFGFSPWMYMMMGIRMLIFIGLIILGVRFLKNHTMNWNSALNILDEKFAKGEISEEEYIKRKTVIVQKR